MTSVKIPYEHTTIPPERTKGEIEKLLKDHGISDIQWTTYKGDTILRFLWHLTIKGIEKEIMFEFKPPIIDTKKMIQTKYGRTKATVQLEATAYRLLYWYLKNKLEAVQFGLQSIEKEFLSQAVVALPNGKETTVGESIESVLETVRSPALAYRPECEEEQNHKVIDL